MREIKFRGKSIDTREWVYGYYIKSGPDFHGGERHCIATPGTVADYAGLKFIQVDPKTVGQFSGVPDKNGREIYEGDIILKRWWDKPYSNRAKGKYLKCIVEWDDENSKYDIIPVDKEHGMRGYDGGELSSVEVIGTIHENLECMEEI